MIRLLERLDARAYIALGSFLLVLAVFAMILWERSLLDSDAFLILATAIVITGWVQGPVGWAYQATKNGGELAERNAQILGDQADKPRKVQIDQPRGEPIPTTSVDDEAQGDDDGLPDYARP